MHERRVLIVIFLRFFLFFFFFYMLQIFERVHLSRIKDISNFSPRCNTCQALAWSYTTCGARYKTKTMLQDRRQLIGLCPGVPVHKGITIVLSLFRSHWLAVVYCLVFCIGSCEPVHEDRTVNRTLFSADQTCVWTLIK